MGKSKRLTSAGEDVGGMLSYATASHVLFDRMEYGDSLLLLYHKSDCYKQVFRDLIVTRGNGEVLVNYLSHKKNRLPSTPDYPGYTFRQIDGETLKEMKTHLDTYLTKLEDQRGEGLLLVDWGEGKAGQCGLFLPFLEELVRKCRGGALSQNLKGKKGKKRVMLVNAVDTSQVDTDVLSKAISLHERTILLQEGHSSVILPKMSPSWKKVSPKIQVLPQQLLESFLKADLEFVVLLLLESRDKSGYQLLKDIAHQFHCILSQGTIYPLLYKLEKSKKIIKTNGKGREVIYSLAPEAAETLEMRKENFIKAISHFAGFISAAGKAAHDEETKETQTSLPVFAAGSYALNLPPDAPRDTKPDK